MSQEYLENIERAYEAMSRLDAEAMVALCEPDVEFRSRIAEADDVTYRGHDGVRDYIASLAEVFEWVRTEPLDVVGGSDRAVVCNRFRARGRHSGLEFEERFFQAHRRTSQLCGRCTRAGQQGTCRRGPRCSTHTSSMCRRPPTRTPETQRDAVEAAGLSEEGSANP